MKPVLPSPSSPAGTSEVFADLWEGQRPGCFRVPAALAAQLAVLDAPALFLACQAPVRVDFTVQHDDRVRNLRV
ncbi:hypothetical protein, partial [Hyalangium sp.]|uniref:hypothetical protein n=1 Tax=Hyalangium sp. TaxID=2028555 RepID=UPI002D6888D6